ncbi:MAG: hypothetical protein QOH30_3435 [Baekduia sp.]|jgi:hypothetical protein|nr:hypothetical protein [Baekduia sp.]
MTRTPLRATHRLTDGAAMLDVRGTSVVGSRAGLSRPSPGGADCFGETTDVRGRPIRRPTRRSRSPSTMVGCPPAADLARVERRVAGRLRVQERRGRDPPRPDRAPEGRQRRRRHQRRRRRRDRARRDRLGRRASRDRCVTSSRRRRGRLDGSPPRRCRRRERPHAAAPVRRGRARGRSTPRG